MRLFLKRDTSMSHSRFIVSDSNGETKFVVTGKYNDAIQKMAISSPQGEVLIKIRMLISKVLSTFIIRSDDEHFTIIGGRRVSPDFSIFGINWKICASADFRTFEVFDADGSLLMTQKSDTCSSKGYYTLDIFTQRRELLCLAVAICIDVYNFADSVVAATI